MRRSNPSPSMQRMLLMAESSWHSSPSPSVPVRRASSGSSDLLVAHGATAASTVSDYNRETFLVVEDDEGGGDRSMVRMTKSMHGRLVV